MDKVLSFLLEGVSSGNVLTISIVLVAAVVFNMGNISNFINTRKKLKISLIEDALNNSHINGGTKIYLEGLIEDVYFESITGLRMEKEAREELVKVYRNAKGEMNFRNFKRAASYYEYKDGSLLVKIDVFSKFAWAYNVVFGPLIMLFSFVLFMLGLLPHVGQETNAYLTLSSAVFFLCIGFLMLMQAIPVISARRVRKYFEKIKEQVEA